MRLIIFILIAIFVLNGCDDEQFSGLTEEEYYLIEDSAVEEYRWCLKRNTSNYCDNNY